MRKKRTQQNFIHSFFSMKKLIFVLILLYSIDIIHRLLLLLPFTWFKSEVKDTVVEPVVIVEKEQITGFKSEVKDTVVEPVVLDDLLDKSKESILKWLQDVRTSFEVEKRQMGILFYRLNYSDSKYGEWGWYKDGDEKMNYKYVGEIKNGKPNGQGKWTFIDGKNYVGEFRNGKFHGQGTFTRSDGEKFIGEFKNGKRWNGKDYDKEGNLLGKNVNGKWIKN